MTEQEQFLACAELDGLSCIETPEFGWAWFQDTRRISNWSDWETSVGAVRNYDSRDAIIGVIEKQSGKVQGNTAQNLYSKGALLGVLLATPAQLREALLRATGKWKE